MSILQVLTWMHALVQDLASNRVFLDAYGEVYLEA